MSKMKQFYIRLKAADETLSPRMKALAKLNEMSLEETEQIKSQLVWTSW